MVMKILKISIVALCLVSNTTFATTLSEALIHTYQTNPELIAAREELKAVDEQMFRAVSGFLPKAVYTARKTYDKDDTRITAVSANDTSETQVVKDDIWQHSKKRVTDLSIEQNLFRGGQDVMAIKIAKYTIESGREKLATAEQQVFAEAINVFLGVINAKKVLEINKENVVSFEKKYESIKERVLAGVDKQADLARVYASKLDAFTNLAIASGNYESAIAAYFRTIGLEPENLKLGDELGTLPANQMELISKSVVSNPGVKNVIFQQKAAALQVYSKAAPLLPSVDIGGNIGKRWVQNNSLEQPYTNTKTAFIQVSIPIYNRGLEYSYTREASASAARLKYIVRNVKNTVTQDATKSWNTYVSTLEAEKSAKEAVNASEIALDAVQQSYNEGVDQLTALLNSQEDLYNYRTKMARVEYELGVSRFNVVVMLGKLTAKDLALETKLYNPTANYDKVKFKLIGF